MNWSILVISKFLIKRDFVSSCERKRIKVLFGCLITKQGPEPVLRHKLTRYLL